MSNWLKSLHLFGPVFATILAIQPSHANVRMFWTDNTSLVTIRYIPSGVVAYYITGSRFHYQRRMSNALRKLDARDSYCVSPDGKWLLGIGFGLRPKDNSASYFALNLKNNSSVRRVRAGIGVRMIWAEDSQSWFDFNSADDHTDSVQFFIHSQRTKIRRLSGAPAFFISRGDRGRLLAADGYPTELSMNSSMNLFWSDEASGIRQDAFVLGAGHGLHLVDCDFAPETGDLAVIES